MESITAIKKNQNESIQELENEPSVTTLEFINHVLYKVQILRLFGHLLSRIWSTIYSRINQSLKLIIKNNFGAIHFSVLTSTGIDRLNVSTNNNNLT